VRMAVYVCSVLVNVRLSENETPVVFYSFYFWRLFPANISIVYKKVVRLIIFFYGFMMLIGFT
jgi:hypothetical protein